MEISKSTDARAIVSTIVYLARSLKLSAVAEGIEKKAELEFLKRLGCNQYQGFLFSRPVPSNEIVELLTH